MWQRFDTWSDVLKAAQRGERLWYQAPFDLSPRSILVVKVYKNDKIRIDPLSNQADPFTADAGHLSRFRRKNGGGSEVTPTRAHATVKQRAVPGIGKWNTYAGGTSAAEGKHSYDLYVPEGQYKIWPVSSQFGRHLGYSLKFAGTHGRPRGSHGGLWHDLGMHRSPQIAASAAAKHYAAGFES